MLGGGASYMRQGTHIARRYYGPTDPPKVLATARYLRLPVRPCATSSCSGDGVLHNIITPKSQLVSPLKLVGKGSLAPEENYSATLPISSKPENPSVHSFPLRLFCLPHRTFHPSVDTGTR
jgi:hypothetical protein